ncbi:uncharacterized protein LOC100203132 isoform X2 [Hydra vulgaris]|uniref:uncharacterized protein LOC100203132 isoform X2 n=1 Tax=Hydra vulgaris TaxID=6087 RepID=UPI001F5EA993|nr:uncharacterized protein LOC100203132 isoform X2 [Hydra vulgaris]
MFRQRSLVIKFLVVVLTVCALICAKTNVNHKAKRKRSYVYYTQSNITGNELILNNRKNNNSSKNLFENNSSIKIKIDNGTITFNKKLDKLDKSKLYKTKNNSINYNSESNKLLKPKKNREQFKNSKVNRTYKYNTAVSFVKAKTFENERYTKNRKYKRKADPQYYYAREPDSSIEPNDLLRDQDIPSQNSEMISSNLGQNNRFSAPQMMERKSLRDRLLEALNRRVQRGPIVQNHPNIMQDTSGLNEIDPTINPSERTFRLPNQMETPYNHLGRNRLLFQKKEITPRPLPFINQRHFTNLRPLQDDMEFGSPHNNFFQGDRIHDTDNKFYREERVNSYVPSLNRPYASDGLQINRIENPILREQVPIPSETIPLHRSPIFASHEDRDFLNADHGASLLSNNVGSLGDEVMPYGSLGETKPERFISPIHSDEDDSQMYGQAVNQESARDDLQEELPEMHHHHHGRHPKKTWVTDVNVFSKKKKVDELDQFFQEDDDPMDEYDPCDLKPCRNGGICKINGNTNVEYNCICPRTFKGVNCEIRNRCHPNPCAHGSKCTQTKEGFECACPAGFKGKRCTERNYCLPNPCFNDGVCSESNSVDRYSCSCIRNWFGKVCDQHISKADSSLESMASILHVGETNENAVEKSQISFPRDKTPVSKSPCEFNPCSNNGMCVNDPGLSRGYYCECTDEYQGTHCEERKCKCQNGGSCIGEGVESKCFCKAGYGGITCQEYDKCKPNPCLHGGRCLDFGDFSKCECKKGFKGKQCEDIDFCVPNPCQNNGQCFGFPGGFQCECPKGFNGKTCQHIIHCLSNPCLNGGECSEVGPTYDKPHGSFVCQCKSGFSGDSCQNQDFCRFSSCLNGGTCSNSKDGFICNCPKKYLGKNCEKTNYCFDGLCKNGANCVSRDDHFSCECMIGFKGSTCEEIDFCEPNPCQNLGVCSSSKSGFTCQCTEGFKGITCTESDPCFPNPCIHGKCTEFGGSYSCSCTLGFKGLNCGEIAHCEPNPCFHNGVCQEIKGGVGFVCQCVSGYKGQMCQKKDLCNPNPCSNDGKCSDLLEDVQVTPNSLLSGNYVPQKRASEGEIKCTCAAGFMGERCNQINPCYPNPCEHNSLCIADHGANIQCNCSLGWKGKHCEEADLCAPDPCRYGTHCQQTSAESYTCLKNLCSPNPCSNGGQCIVVNDEAFQCACPRGWRGKICSEQDLCVPNPCENGGVCHVNNDAEFSCECVDDYIGAKCQVHKVESLPTKKSFCAGYPCKNGGTCLDTDGGFTCRCNNGFSGPFCDESVCFGAPCENSGTCVPYYGIALCKCTEGYTGAHCSEIKKRGPKSFHISQQQDQQQPHSTVTKSQVTNVSPSAILFQRVEEILNSDKEVDTIQPNLIEGSKLTAENDKPKHITPPTHSSNPVIAPTEIQTISPITFRLPDLLTTLTYPTTAIQPAPTFLVHVQSKSQSIDDVCNPNLCEHGGTCVVRSDNQPECICLTDFSGPRCEDIGMLGYSSAPKFFPNDECNHCDKNAVCTNGHCICAKGFVGDGLECWPFSSADSEWNCNPNPCQNGGTCKNGRSHCVCRLGYVGIFCEKYCPPSVHLSFDSKKDNFVQDESGNENNAVLMNGAKVVYEGGKCDSGVSLSGGDILFDGEKFKNKPVDAITMALWIKLDSTSGIQSVFDTVGGKHSTHRDGQYHVEIDNGKIRWFHRNEYHMTIFSVVTKPILQNNVWTHIGGTYNAAKREAKLFLNGDLVGIDNHTSILRNLSQDWETKTGIGKHEHPFGNRLLRGMIDEFYIFSCELPRIEVLVLMHHCKIYWKNDERKKKPTLVRSNPILFYNGDSSVHHDNYGYVTKESNPSVKIERISFSNKPVTAEVTVPGQARYNIPTHMDLSRPELGSTEISGYKNILPNGPSALYSEMRELLQNEGLLDQDKHGQLLNINEQSLRDIEKKLNIKLKPNIKSRYSHAPIIRNDNHELPFSPHAYFSVADNIVGVSRSTLPENPDDISNVNIAGPTAFMFNHENTPQTIGIETERSKQPFVLSNYKAKPDPRWFQWQKGLAMVSGGTYTNTHSNTLQRNDPGNVNANTHVSSSQGAKTGTKISSSSPDQPPQQLVSSSHPFVQLKHLLPVSSHVFPQQSFTNQQLHSSYNTYNPNTQSINNHLQQQQIPREFAAMRDLIMQYPHAPWQHAPQQPQNPIKFTQQSHQWGYGNGQGNGNGIGTPSASGSGGGWGAGGPLSQNMNLPAWSGSGDPPHSKDAPKRTLDQQLPPNARELWNQFVAASKRQSQSSTHVYNTNVAQSGILMNTQSVNSGKNVKVQSHQYGFGNGNGDANGYGNPGGSGTGGGWGAGGPTYQNTWLPNQQKPRQPPLQQKSTIHSSSLQSALVTSFTAPWLVKTNKQMQNTQTDNYGVPSAVVNAKRSYVPSAENFGLRQMRRNNLAENYVPLNSENMSGELSKYDTQFKKPTQFSSYLEKYKKSIIPNLNNYALYDSHEIKQKTNYELHNPVLTNSYEDYYKNQHLVQNVRKVVTKPLPDTYFRNLSSSPKSFVNQPPNIYENFDPNFEAAREYMNSHVTLAKFSSPFSSFPVLNYKYEPLKTYLMSPNINVENKQLLSLIQRNPKSQISRPLILTAKRRENMPFIHGPFNINNKNKQFFPPQTDNNKAYSLIKSGDDRLVQSDTGASFVSVDFPRLSNSEKLMMMKKKRKKRSETSKRSLSSIR